MITGFTKENFLTCRYYQIENNRTEVNLITGQNNFSMIRPIEYKHQNKRDPWGVKTPLGWSLSGSL